VCARSSATGPWCSVALSHKRRNVADHLPERERELIDAKLTRALAHPDPDLGHRAARELAAGLDRTHPSAANSIREGLQEMFTVRRLGLSEASSGP